MKYASCCFRHAFKGNGEQLQRNWFAYMVILPLCSDFTLIDYISCCDIAKHVTVIAMHSQDTSSTIYWFSLWKELPSSSCLDASWPWGIFAEYYLPLCLPPFVVWRLFPQGQLYHIRLWSFDFLALIFYTLNINCMQSCFVFFVSFFIHVNKVWGANNNIFSFPWLPSGNRIVLCFLHSYCLKVKVLHSY